MKLGDAQKGIPQIPYSDTKANIEALSGLTEGAVAYATDDDKLGYYNGSSWVWVSAGESSGGMTVLGFASSTSDSTVNPDVTSDTQVNSMAVTFTLSATKTVKIEVQIVKSGGHPERYAVYDSASKLLPANGISSGYYDLVSSENSEYKLTFVCYVSLASGSHTINIKHQAAQSTNGITFKERWLICSQLD